MCDPVSLSLVGAAAIGTAYGVKRINKDKKQTKATLNAINKQTEERIEHNKLANSVQSTEELKNPTLADKLKQQKVPLNTGSTGTQFSTPTSVGLNLGGY